MSEQDDALTVSKWCWPGMDPNLHPVCNPLNRDIATFDPESWEADEFSCHGVLDAEQVVLARGLAERYGSALAMETLGPVWELQPGPTICNITGVEFAKLAMAPLSARLRALARVARENPQL